MQEKLDIFFKESIASENNEYDTWKNELFEKLNNNNLKKVFPLSEQQTNVFRMHFIDNLSRKEIAQKIGTSQSYVRSVLVVGRRWLNSYYGCLMRHKKNGELIEGLNLSDNLNRRLIRNGCIFADDLFSLTKEQIISMNEIGNYYAEELVLALESYRRKKIKATHKG